MRGRPVPVILTERLRLRGVEASDFETLKAHWSHPDTIRFIGGLARPPQLVWTRSVLGSRGLWATLGYGYWFVEDRRTGDFVGEVGFADFHRDSEPDFWGLPECGWVISPALHGKGYASEAVKAIHDWFDIEVDEPKSVCIIDEENHASRRIAARIGYHQARTVRLDGKDVLYFERTRGG